MSSRTRRGPGEPWYVALAFAVLVAALSAIAAGAASASPRIVGEVYVNDNTAGLNTVAGYYRRTDGTLTAIPRSPFAVGGAGTHSVRETAAAPTSLAASITVPLLWVAVWLAAGAWRMGMLDIPRSGVSP